MLATFIGISVWMSLRKEKLARAAAEGRAHEWGAKMDIVMHTHGGWRPRLDRWLETAPIHNSLIALILINAVILGLETSPALMAQWGSWPVSYTHLDVYKRQARHCA